MRLVFIGMFFISTVLFADHHVSKNHDSKSHFHPHLDYNFNLEADDQGYKDKEAYKGNKNHRYYDPKMKFSYKLLAKVYWHGKFNDIVDYKVEFVSLPAIAFVFPHEISAHIKVSKLFHVKAGHIKVQQGGLPNLAWDINKSWHDNNAHFTLWAHQYFDNLISFHFLAFGNLSVQFLKDGKKSGESNDGYIPQGQYSVIPERRYYNKDDTIAFNLAWDHDFSGITPLFQFGMYDDFKSMHYSGGVKVVKQGFEFIGSFMQNIRKKIASSKDVTDTATEYSAYLAYNFQDILTPYLRFSQVNVKQDPAPSEKIKANTNASITNFNNNGRMISAGVAYNYTKNFEPYFAFDMENGKFVDQASPTKEKDYSNMWFKFGFAGSI